MRWSSLAPLVLVFATGAACAGQAVGELVFDPPAEFRGARMSVVLPGPSYLAAYDVGNETQVGVVVEFQASGLQRVAYEQSYIWAGPAGYGGVPQTERYEEHGLGDVRSFSIVETLRNFTMILRLGSPTEVETSHGTIQAPLASGLLMSKGTRRDRLEPNLNEEPWQANFVDVAMEGPARHHLLTREAALVYEGPVEVFLSHAVIDLDNETGRHRLLLDTTLRFEGSSPSGAAPGPVARYDGTMLRGTGTGRIIATIQAPFVRLLEVRPTLTNVEMLAAPLADGRLAAADGSAARFHNRSHLDVAGNFTVRLHPPQMSSEGRQAIVSSLEGDVVGFAVDRAPFEPFGSPTVAAVASGIGALVVVYLVVSLIRRGAWAAVSSKAHLILLGWFPFSAKLEERGVLAHPLRKELLALVAEEGGPVRLRDLQRRAGDSTGASRLLVYYHLGVLARSGAVAVFQRAGRGSVFVMAAYQVGGGAASAKMVLTSPLARLIGKTVVEDLEVSQAELVRRVLKRWESAHPDHPRSRAAVYNWLRRMESPGVRIGNGWRGAKPPPRKWAGPALIRRGRAGKQVMVRPEPALLCAFPPPSSGRTASVENVDPFGRPHASGQAVVTVR